MPPPRPTSSRRTFLKQAAFGASLPLILPHLARGQNAGLSQVRHAVIGVGGLQGASDRGELASASGIEIAALCDVNQDHLDAAAKKHPKAALYTDWREMLSKEAGKIDSVNVCTPDHLHASIALSAMRAGLHVYCQKPLTLNIREARTLRLEAASRPKLVTQMGNQIQSTEHYRTGTGIIRSGRLGKIREVHAWSGSKFIQKKRPTGDSSPIASLNWDHWIGPAPERPFVKDAYYLWNGLNWRGFQDFGGTGLGDFTCLILDTPFRALGLNAPLTVKAEVTPGWREDPVWYAEGYPEGHKITYVFPANSLTAGDLKAVWYDGVTKPSRDLLPPGCDDVQLPGGGSLVIGTDDCMILPHIGAPMLIPKNKQRPEPLAKVAGANHYHEFIRAIRGESKCTSHFGYSGWLTETTCLGLVASHHAGETLQWEFEKLSFKGNPAATARVGKPYREGWKIEGLG